MRAKVKELKELDMGTRDDGLSKVVAQDILKPPEPLNIILDSYSISAWYSSPFQVPSTRTLYICNRCLNYYPTPTLHSKHALSCPFILSSRTVYKTKELEIVKVDGDIKPFAQNLCLIGKLFIQHKTICFDTSPFDFYILYSTTGKTTGTSHTRSNGVRSNRSLIGYFSKEKYSAESYNLSCLLVLPPYHNQGHGQLLIETSYRLHIDQNTSGGPEHPLSTLGEKSYHRYWESILACLFRSNAEKVLTIGEVSALCAMEERHVIDTLVRMGVAVRNGLICLRDGAWINTSERRLIKPECWLGELY